MMNLVNDSSEDKPVVIIFLLRQDGIFHFYPFLETAYP
jgi:hypothetical protein